MQVIFDPTKFKSKAEWQLINAGLSRMDDQSALRQIEECGYEIDDGTAHEEPPMAVAAPVESPRVELTFVPTEEPTLSQEEKDGIMDGFMRSFATDGVFVDLVENDKDNLIDSHYRSKAMSKISYFDPKDVTEVMEWNETYKTGKILHRIYRFSPNVLKFGYGDEFEEPDLMMPQYVTKRRSPYKCLLVSCEKYNWSEAFAIDDKLRIPLCVTERLTEGVLSYWPGMSMIGTRSFAVFRNAEEVLDTYRGLVPEHGIEVVEYSVKKLVGMAKKN